MLTRPHVERLLGAVLPAEEPDLLGPLLADLAGQDRRPEAAVEGPDPGAGLAEAGVVGGDGEVAHDVEDVAPADGVAGHHGHDRLGQPPDLDVEVGDQEPTDAPLAHGVVADVAGVAPDPLVAPGAERLRPLAGEDDHADVGVLAGQVEGGDELLDGVGPEGVADLGSVDGDLGDPPPAVPVGEGGGGLVADVVPLPRRLPRQGGGDGAGRVGGGIDHAPSLVRPTP